MREGQGSYFYHDKNKLFVGEWVNDQPKTGVYTEVEDDEVEKLLREEEDEEEAAGFIVPDDYLSASEFGLS